jgi:UDP-N-acetylglucosamine 1-carboxyvinyltransferase
MSLLNIKGGKPLFGEVEISGAKNSALKIIIASLFTNEDVYISNVPKVKSLERELQILESLGSKVEWLSSNYLKINNSKLHSSKISMGLGKNLNTSFLFAGPLLYRFGEATIPLPDSGTEGLDRFIETWSSLNIEINFDANFLYLRSDNSKAGIVEITRTSHTATDNAILSSIFLNGETTIINSSEEIEVKDLVSFCNLLGATIEYENKRVLRIKGQRHFRGTDFSVVSDLAEVVYFSVLALITNGNIIIKNIDKSHLSFLISFLNKVEANFEFTTNSELRIWKKIGEIRGFEVTAGSYPGIISDYIPYFLVLSLFCEGESKITDLTYRDKFDYVYQLNKYNSKIKIYEGEIDFEKCEMYIKGPAKFSFDKVNLEAVGYSPAFLLLCLGVATPTEILGYEKLDYVFENLIEKVVKLGADVKYD